MLYRLSAMEGTSFRQISNQMSREQVGSGQHDDPMAINSTETERVTKQHHTDV